MIRTVLAFVLLGWAILASAQDAAPREARIEVPVEPGWTETGIVVEAGDKLTITSTGTHNLPPGGYPGRTLPDTLAPELPPGALIGRIGEAPPFLVGGAYSGTAPAPGSLLLGLNFGEQRARATIPVVIRHEPAPKPLPDPDIHSPPRPSPTGNESTANSVDPVANVAVENGSAEVALPAPPPPPPPPPPPSSPRPGAPVAVVPPPPSGDPPGAMSWALGGLGLLLLAAAAGFAVQRAGRARTVKRTRAMLGLSPRLDLGEGISRGGELPAEGPAASLRARLEPGAVRMAEGEEDG